MSVNKHPTKEGAWQVRYRPNGRKGKEVVLVVEGSREDALEYEAELRTEAKAKPISAFPAVSETIPEYLQHYKMNSLDAGPVTRYLDRWKSYLGNMRFPDVNETVIERYKSERKSAGIAPVTINKELSAISMLLKWAAKKKYCQKPDFIERFPAKMTTAPLPDVPTREDVLALINAMIWPKCGMFACLYFGGLRKAEAQGLRAENIYLDRGVMIVRGKGNKQRVIPIVDELRPWLEKRVKELGGKGLLWTTRTGRPITDLDKIIELASARAGVTIHIYPHLLRHAFGTHATMSGVGMRPLQKIMGHTSIRTTEIYTTLADEAVISELAGKFGKKPV